LPREQILNKHAHDLWPADVVDTEVAMDAKLLKDARVQTYETTIPAAGGVRHPVIITRDAYYNADGSVAGLVGAIIDITERKRAEAEREELNRKLVIASRQAGKAEIATNVLHNVGNVLNGVSVSASLVRDRARASRVGSLRQIADMLRAQQQDLVHFFTADDRGKQLPRYVEKLVEHLSAERDATLNDLQVLGKNVDHIRHIINLQQRDAGISRMMEQVALVELIEDAIRINATNLEQTNIEIVREFVDVQPIMTDKHKVLQILVNLVSNARTALVESSTTDRRLVLRLEMTEGQMRLQVRDNGVGISVENLKRIFQHGFTTRKDGHGFGLHSGSLAAQELGGRLIVESEGLGRGATFTLLLPVAVEAKQADGHVR
jgi:two-component system sensor kinase FixL